MLRIIGKQSGESVDQSWRRKGKWWEGFPEKESFEPEMKEWGVMDDESGESMEPIEEVWFDDFYRAMLCIRSTSHGPVSVCVCLSQVGVLLKRLNVGSHK